MIRLYHIRLVSGIALVLMGALSGRDLQIFDGGCYE